MPRGVKLRLAAVTLMFAVSVGGHTGGLYGAPVGPELKFSMTATEPVLMWTTPCWTDQVENDVFDVVDAQGNHAMYTGQLARHLPPTDRDFLQAGQSVTCQVDLAELYALERDGVYTVSWKFDHLFTTRIKVIGARGDTHRYNGTHVLNETMALNPPLIGCDAEETGILLEVVGWAVEDVFGRRSCVADRSCPVEYQEWMGIPTDDRQGTVQSCLNTLNGFFQGGSYRLACDTWCKDNPLLYALVNAPDPSRTVQLCGGFWLYPLERVNTLVHELCHFRSSCDFRDHVYGKEQVRRLAITNPDTAVINPDNYAYFTDRNAYVSGYGVMDQTTIVLSKVRGPPPSSNQSTGSFDGLVLNGTKVNFRWAECRVAEMCLMYTDTIRGPQGATPGRNEFVARMGMFTGLDGPTIPYDIEMYAPDGSGPLPDSRSGDFCNLIPGGCPHRGPGFELTVARNFDDDLRVGDEYRTRFTADQVDLIGQSRCAVCWDTWLTVVQG